MEVVVLCLCAVVLICLLVLITLLKRKYENGATADEEPAVQAQPRRVVGARNARAARLRVGARHAGAAGADGDAAPEEDEDEARPELELPDKVGAKKRAKLEAKAEKKALREVEERLREERKQRQQQEDEERQRESALREEEERRQEQAERQAREERERKELEEYLKMKEMFSVEEEGCEETDAEQDQGSLLQQFITYIKTSKVVLLEDLAAHFKLKTQSIIDRIQDLQSEGALTGVIDDRGKFIYISPEELQAVARFVKQRGRVSISELAESSNQLINLDASINQRS
ncbi:DDRGK domain-containing protein 1 [Bacillus rossius redtenbacheri]|uniref:DDRGK domain-containing protein 1 n=1 Tax=Bacillus rossius redtenbacheri TaxID=93214 RepID=UPI002FDDAB52